MKFKKDLLTKLEIIRLQNGSKLFFYYDPTCAFTHFDIVFRAGWAFDPKGKEGLTHLVEHMMTETSGYNLLSIINYFKKHRAIINPGCITEVDSEFGFQASRDTFDALLGTFLDIILPKNKKYSPVKFGMERAVILREYAESFPTKKYETILHRSARFMYKNNPYRDALAPPSAGMGTRNSILGLTIDDTETFRRNYFHQDQADIVCIGGTSKTKLLSLLAMYGVFQEKKKGRMQYNDSWGTQTGYSEYDLPLGRTVLSESGELYNLTARYCFPEMPTEKLNIYLEMFDISMFEYLRVKHPFVYEFKLNRLPIPGGNTLELKFKCERKKVLKAERAFMDGLNHIISDQDSFETIRQDKLTEIEFSDPSITHLHETVLEYTEPFKVTTLEEDYKSYRNVSFADIKQIHTQITEQSRGTIVRAF